MSQNNNKVKAPEQNTDISMPYEVTAQGSLGLLALGAAGIDAWRKKREEEKLNSKTQQDND